MPVAVELSLFFKETEIMTKDNYRKSVGGVNFGSFGGGRGNPDTGGGLNYQVGSGNDYLEYDA